MQIQNKVDEQVGRGKALDCGGYHLLTAQLAGYMKLAHESLPKKTQARRLLHQARVLSWGKEKRYYSAHKLS
jgi:hypothetical protein